MADSLTAFDIGAIIAIVGALVTTIGVLWRAFQKNVAELKSQRAHDRAEMSDLVERVRHLEDARLTEVKEYASKLEAMQRQSNAVFRSTINALQDITRTVGEWMNSPCPNSDPRTPRPTPLPEIETDVLMAKHDKAARTRDEENDRP